MLTGIDYSRTRRFMMNIGLGDVSTRVDKEKLLGLKGDCRSSGGYIRRNSKGFKLAKCVV